MTETEAEHGRIRQKHIFEKKHKVIRGVYKRRPKAKKVLLQDQLHVGKKFQIEKPREGSA